MEPFVGEIKIFGGNYAPYGYALCNGQLMPISENTALFSLIGTTYGGDGINTFALPDLRGRVPIHRGQGPGLANYTIGQSGGSETVTLNSSHLPVHAHTASCNSGNGTSADPTHNFWAASADLDVYTDQTPNVEMAPDAGSAQSHDNMLPFQILNFIIALEGIFPSRN
jgi:microcystin-dependent protein